MKRSCKRFEDRKGPLMKRVGITADCVCDLPEEYLRTHGVDLIYSYVVTDRGRFQDGCEITSGNILEYLESGGEKVETRASATQDYRVFFENHLKEYDEIVHIGVSSGVSQSYGNATASLKLIGEMGKRVTVVDSEHLSTGMGHLVMRAVELRDSGSTAREIVEAITRMRGKVSTSFITRKADYLYQNARVSAQVAKFSAFFDLHPVLDVEKGRISLKMFRIGNYERCVIRYIRSALRHSGQIDTRRLFITHAGCTVKMLSQIKAEAESLCAFDEVVVTQASATVSGNFGPDTVGVLFIRK